MLSNSYFVPIQSALYYEGWLFKQEWENTHTSWYSIWRMNPWNMFIEHIVSNFQTGTSVKLTGTMMSQLLSFRVFGQICRRSELSHKEIRFNTRIFYFSPCNIRYPDCCLSMAVTELRGNHSLFHYGWRVALNLICLLLISWSR